MKIALIGYGKMGKLLHSLAETKGHSIIAIVDSKQPLSSRSSQEAIQQADVCIDFSTPESVLENVKFLSARKKNIVMGTTGWSKDLPKVQEMIAKSSTGFLHAPNFSIGVVLFLQILEKAAHLISPFQDYDIAGLEIHHKQKLDSPSGTAKAITSKLEPILANKPLTFSSARVGNTPGTHSVIFDSPVDTITLTHAARNREGFVHGAITAAEWLQGKQGMFTLDDILKGYSHESI